MFKHLRDRIVDRPALQRALNLSARFRLLPSRLLMRLPALGVHELETPLGRRLTYAARRDDFLARAVVWSNLKGWESGTVAYVSSLAKSGGTFVDVGAYSGIFSLVWCIDGPGDAIAIEPNPEAREFLRSNVLANQLETHVRIVPHAAGRNPGLSRLTVPSADPTAARLDANGTGLNVEVKTLDELVPAHSEVTLIKIDVEGLEPDVIVGGRAVLARSSPAVITECLTELGFDAVRAVLQPLGYTCCEHLSPTGPVIVTSFVEQPRWANFVWTVAKTI